VLLKKKGGNWAILPFSVINKAQRWWHVGVRLFVDEGGLVGGWWLLPMGGGDMLVSCLLVGGGLLVLG
jgi:hypothetical protein